MLSDEKIRFVQTNSSSGNPTLVAKELRYHRKCYKDYTRGFGESNQEEKNINVIEKEEVIQFQATGNY